MEKTQKFQDILNNKPLLHCWGGVWSAGGFGSDQALETIINYAFKKENPVILETGSGLSTLIFLSMNPKKLITISPDMDIKPRIDQSIMDFNLDSSVLDYIEEVGETALPFLANELPYLDMALLDGGHGYTSVFVQFYFMNKILKKEGYIIVDDIQLKPPRLLNDLLCESASYNLVETNKKTAIFQKLCDESHVSSHFGQNDISF